MKHKFSIFFLLSEKLQNWWFLTTGKRGQRGAKIGRGGNFGKFLKRRKILILVIIIIWVYDISSFYNFASFLIIIGTRLKLFEKKRYEEALNTKHDFKFNLMKLVSDTTILLHNILIEMKTQSGKKIQSNKNK